MSTSSTSLEASPKVLFHSSINGPVEVSLAITPTFFCTPHQHDSILEILTSSPYPRAFDYIHASLKQLNVLFRILAPNKDLDWNLASL